MHSPFNRTVFVWRDWTTKKGSSGLMRIFEKRFGNAKYGVSSPINYGISTICVANSCQISTKPLSTFKAGYR